MIIFENVTKRYGQRVVLDNVNLMVSPGEFVTVTGPSGAGKSTLINALIGAENIQRGHISVDSYIINSLKEKSLQYYRRKIGTVFQDYKLLPQKNVYENVAFAMEVCGYENHYIQKRVREVLEIVGLQEQRRQFPRQLSGGECQRTSIARALVHNPRLVIADEPTGNLDPHNAKEIIDLLLKINKNGATVILATHNPILVDHIHKRVVRLDRGRVIGDKAQSGYV